MHLSRDKPAAKTLRKQLKKRIDAALGILKRRRVSDEQIHEARKALKKARACLRLLHPGLKASAYHRENAALRDAARPLSAARDAKVLVDTLRSLVKRYGAPGRALKLDPLKRALKAHRVRTNRALFGARGNALAHSRRLLRECSHRISGFALGHDRDDWAVVGAGLKRIYGRGRRALAAARDTPSPNAFHAWRKQTKYLRYALEMLEPLWPGPIGERSSQLQKLSDSLGDEHDLTVLRAMALSNRDLIHNEAALSALLALIDRRQGELRDKAISLGLRLYEEKPRAFAERFGQYWQEWRDEAPRIRRQAQSSFLKELPRP